MAGHDRFEKERERERERETRRRKGDLQNRTESGTDN